MITTYKNMVKSYKNDCDLSRYMVILLANVEIFYILIYICEDKTYITFLQNLQVTTQIVITFITVHNTKHTHYVCSFINII